MRNSEQLIRALSALDDESIEQARLALGYRAAKERRPGKKLVRVLLLAAVLTALFTVTAYAAGWFGLSSRLTPAENEVTGTNNGTDGYISLNDYAESPAGKAHAEWRAFWQDYVSAREWSNVPDKAWMEGHEDWENYNIIYAAYDETMVEKLLELRDRYGIRLHNRMIFPPNNETFYELTGLCPFVDEGEGSNLQLQYIYEDGSFKGEGILVNGELYGDYTVVRGAKEVLDPSGNYINRAEEYTEWQFTTAKGALVNIAMIEPEDGAEMSSVILFYDGGDYLVTVFAGVSTGDEARRSAEAFADCFDFAGICKGKTDLSAVTETKPSEARAKEGLLSLQDLMKTDEYLASSEFQRRFCEYWGEHDENSHVAGFMQLYYYGDFPPADEAVRNLSDEILARYKLTAPGKVQSVYGAIPVDGNRITPDGGYREAPGEDYTKLPSVSEAEIYRMAGLHPFLTEGKAVDLSIWENGSFYMRILFGHSSHRVNYIPKGAFYPQLRYVLHPDMTGWAYDTACGEQVYLVEGGEPEYPVTDMCYILYETDEAYVVIETAGEPYLMELLADDIDFTKFP